MSAPDRLREIAEAATPGQWRVDLGWGDFDGEWPGEEGSTHGWVSPHGAYSSKRADNELIALSPELAEWVADALDRILAAAEEQERHAEMERSRGDDPSNSKWAASMLRLLHRDLSARLDSILAGHAAGETA